MKCVLKKGEIVTGDSTKIYDITKDIKKIVENSEVKNGQIIIQPLHTTAGVYLNEGEERLLQDFIIYLSRKVPQIKGRYLHDDLDKRDCPKDEPLNGHSHIKSALYSNSSLSLILSKGKLQLGKYQRILFAEFDGPCPRKHKSKREYIVSIIGE